MSASKTLLYPFSIRSSYFGGYSWALALAIRMNANLQLFTSTSFGKGVTTSTDSIYHSLLEAHGYYLQHYQQPEFKNDLVRQEPLIVNGELADELLSHLKKKPAVDIVILDPAFSTAYKRGVKKIVEESGAAIVLNNQHPEPGGANEKHDADHFYDNLRSAELYKLPDNFYNTLGRDTSVFNYLRKIFQKRPAS